MHPPARAQASAACHGGPRAASSEARLEGAVDDLPALAGRLELDRAPELAARRLAVGLEVVGSTREGPVHGARLLQPGGERVALQRGRVVEGGVEHRDQIAGVAGTLRQRVDVAEAAVLLER